MRLDVKDAPSSTRSNSRQDDARIIASSTLVPISMLLQRVFPDTESG